MPKKNPSRNASNKAKSRVKPPPVSFDVLGQRADRALALVGEFPNVIDRLPSGAVAELKANRAKIIEARADTGAGRVKAEAATAAQNVGLADLHAFVSGIRVGIHKSDAPKDQKRAYGLGTRVAMTVTSVVGAANVIIKRARANAKEARDLGLLPSDITELDQLVGAVTRADSEQGALLARASVGVAERNTVGNAIWAGIKRVSSRGVIAYARDARARAAFDALDDVPSDKSDGGPTT